MTDTPHGSKAEWIALHKDQNDADDSPIPNVDENWDGEPVILEI